MSRAFIFWLIMLVLLIFGGIVYWPMASGGHFWYLGYPLVNWILMALLGWKVFGSAIHE
jgi:hypothetical protein